MEHPLTNLVIPNNNHKASSNDKHYAEEEGTHVITLDNGYNEHSTGADIINTPSSRQRASSISNEKIPFPSSWPISSPVATSNSNGGGGFHRTRPSLRRLSVTESIKYIAPPISPRFVVLCIVWYSCSALSNNLNKSILTCMPYPISLTLIQFILTVFWSVLICNLSRTISFIGRLVPLARKGLRAPSKRIFVTVFPLGIFQLSGHIFSHFATREIPVSLVHTIKGMSPVFTVIAYRFLFRVKYSVATYISLVPLTAGVMLACSFELSNHISGIICAFVGALIFVSQNIFSKKLMTEEPGEPRKIDKLTLLCYCSGVAFLLTLPLWAVTEGRDILIKLILHPGTADIKGSVTVGANGKLKLLHHGKPGADVGRSSSSSSSLDEPASTSLDLLLLQIAMNGTVHFMQSLLAFTLLGMVSPVSYSVASLFKRIFVIVTAIVYFGQSISSLQGFGLFLTFIGLYLYDRAGGVSKQSRLVQQELPK